MNFSSNMCRKCFFCENRFVLNQSIDLPGEESIIYKNEHVFIIPDISPVVLGHFLIVSEKHRNSFGGVSDDVFFSLLKAKKFVQKKMFAGQRILFFEHGSVFERSAGSSIDHAHIHVLPSNMTTNAIDQFISSSIFIRTKKEPSSREALLKCVADLQPYLYYEIDGEMWYYSTNRVPSQFFRRMICSVTGGGYNWKSQFKTSESKQLFSRTLDEFSRRSPIVTTINI